MTMKIFFDHKIFVNQNYGGPSRYIVNLVSNLNQIENLKAKVFAPMHINNYLDQLKVKEKGLGFKIPMSTQINKYNKIKRKLMEANDFINKFSIKGFQPDIYHTTYYDKSSLSNSKNMVITVYDLIHELFRDEYGFSKNYLPKDIILKQACHIICISESTKKDLVNIYNINPKKITVIYLATNFSSYKNHKDFEKVIDGKYFLFVGSRWKYKNFSNLLKAISINSHLQKNYKLVLFGGGPLVKDEINLINELKINKKNIVHLNGNEYFLKSLYKNAEFFIYPSKYEGFGIPILESFSQSCPVLCSNTSSLPEVAGDAVLFFNPNEPEEISSTIDKFISSIENKNILIKKGLKRLNLFSWSKCAQQTFKVYQKIKQ